MIILFTVKWTKIFCMKIQNTFKWYIRRTRRYISYDGTLSTEVVSLIYNLNKLFILVLFIIIYNFVNLNSQYYLGHYQHQSYVKSRVPQVHVSRYMSQHHPSQAQYQSSAFLGYASQGCQQSFKPLGFSSYMSQYSFHVPSTSNVFYGPS